MTPRYTFEQRYGSISGPLTGNLPTIYCFLRQDDKVGSSCDILFCVQLLALDTQPGIGEKQLQSIVAPSVGVQNSPLMHIALS